MTTQQLTDWIGQHASRTAVLCLDSRQVESGGVFFACKGHQTDGRHYIAQAIERGAAAVLLEANGALDHVSADVAAVPMLKVEELSKKLGTVAHEWYGRPSEALSVVAITGTNGKTSAVQWLAAALNAEGAPCGTVGTFGVTLPDGANLGGVLTTPDVLTMHRSLAAIRDAGGTVAAVEASSIGLDQGRLDAVQIDIAGFTNLTHDHLDYHHTIEQYKAAKLALFQQDGLDTAVVNLDDPVGRELFEQLQLPYVDTYSLHDTTASIQAGDVHTGTHGLVFNLSIAERTAQIVTRLVGTHNISNLLLVAGVLRRLGWPLPRIARALSGLRSIGGRLQVVEALDCDKSEGKEGPMVVVDYAHTPDALRRALEALRETAVSRGGQLICVFGCGGDRDKSKRAMMGELAGQLADSVILTNDNPRSEKPSDILDDILQGMAGQPPQLEPDRAAAILRAIWRADAADVVLVAGKGHETYQETAGQRKPFDDREWSRLALTWRRGASLCSDSRRIAPGQVFLALQGEHFDGHAYLDQVAQAGACAAIVARRNPSIALAQFEVGDTTEALRLLGSQWRRCFDIPAIAVTGSNGKTSTKEMIASILRAWVGDEQALWTHGNLNNDLGVPLTLLELRPVHRAAVFELGMNHPGEISLLANMAQPTVALVNNAQREHQEFMHTVEAVARENGSVISALPADGVAVFPADDTYTDLWQELAQDRRVLSFGLDAAFQVYADQIHAEPAQTGFRLNTAQGSCAVQLKVPGLHNLRNALAAASCALAAGAPLDAVAEGLRGFSPVSGRMQPRALPGGLQLIDDTYNANPDSVRAAIDVLARLQGRKVLVLGDMAEVGSDGPAVHAEVGAYARQQGIDALLTYGAAARECARAFGDSAYSFDDIGPLLECLIRLTPTNILVKGSRSTRMERVVQEFIQQLQAQAQGDHDVA